MGWKAIKEHYRINHHVQVTDEGICIGYSRKFNRAHNLIVIELGVGVMNFNCGRLDGENLTRFADRELRRYEAEMRADPVRVGELVAANDVFQKSITVYTYKDAQIIEKKCEKLGWPNNTHDGQTMSDNAFSTNRAQVVAWAIGSAQTYFNWLVKLEKIERAKLEGTGKLVEIWKENLAALNKELP